MLTVCDCVVYYLFADVTIYFYSLSRRRETLCFIKMPKVWLPPDPK